MTSSDQPGDAGNFFDGAGLARHLSSGLGRGGRGAWRRWITSFFLALRPPPDSTSTHKTRKREQAGPASTTRICKWLRAAYAAIYYRTIMRRP